MENNNKKLPQRRVKRVNLYRQEVWRILTEENDKKLSKTFRYLKTVYPIRFADIFVVLGLFGFYGSIVFFWKNISSDSLRTTYPFKIYLQFWGMFPYTYLRQPKEPFLYRPKDSEFREVELYESYEENKRKLLFNKMQQYDIVLKAEKERITPSLDHREFDMTEFQTLSKINYDITALNLLKQNINKELVDMGIYKDNKIYIKERLATNYKASDYMYKDDLYKELFELTKI